MRCARSRPEGHRRQPGGGWGERASGLQEKGAQSAPRLWTSRFQNGENGFLLGLGFLIVLEHGCFTMVCEFLLDSEVNQLYVHTYRLFFWISFPFPPQNTE